ncbi:MAG: LytR/AlgR family response regulator transcription factor [Thermonemataceae bacterium]
MKERITTVIIDDEYHGRSSLKKLLYKYCEQVEVVGMAHSVETGKALIQSLQPDLLFLDILMPDGNGFDLLEDLPEQAPQVIFTTAHEDYAVKAFRYAAIDYLLKPISIQMLREAIQKFEQRSVFSQFSLEALQYFYKQNTFDKVMIITQRGYLFIEIKDMLYLQADSNYTKIYLAEQPSQMVSKTLHEFEELLAQANFYRIHHSYFINIAHLVAYNHKEGYVQMSDEAQLPVSSRKKSGLFQYCQRICNTLLVSS